MKPKVLAHNHLNDIYYDCERASLGMRRIQFLSVPLIANSICVVLFTLNVKLSPYLVFIIGFFYVMALIGTYHEKLDRRSTSLLREFSIKLKHRNDFFTTPDLPSNPPLYEGYLYARKPFEEFSRPYPMNAYIVNGGKDIDFNTMYFFYVEIANYIWDGKGYGDIDWNQFKLQCLKEFESLGYEIEGLKDKWDQLLWCRDRPSKRSKTGKYFDICQIAIYKGLVIASTLTPFLFLAKFFDLTFF